ncbi:MAG: pyruvate kinase [Nitrospirota bacterium]|nr:pyruvate kinase [Nitrospirota bacterium]
MAITLRPDENIDRFKLGLNHKYLHFRRTKIIATIGPASSSPVMIKKLLRSGMNVCRINFSHGKPDDHLKTMALIRKISAQLRIPVAILGDLCGPKIRVGRFRNDAVTLKDGSIVMITVDKVLGTETLIPCQYKQLVREVKVNEQILLDDGNLELKVLGKENGRVRARVVRGGILKNNKGMNLPDTKLKVAALTAKDRKDAIYCIKGGVDYIALSFVRKSRDIEDLKKILRRRKADIHVIAKIEKPEALDNIREIIAAADGIMIARGDLGVELPAKKVPFIQDTLIEACISERKPVIVATQMLESMMEHGRPTRAEVTDVSMACDSGADAVMLSGETASGKYPLEALTTMDAILRETESYRFFARGGLFRDPLTRPTRDVQDAVSAAISQLSRDLMVRCVLTETRTGRTAIVVAADRPSSPILALTPSVSVLRKLLLIWGVVPNLTTGKLFSVDKSLAFAESFMRKQDIAKSGDYMLLVRGIGYKKTDIQSIIVHQMS